MEQHVGLDVSLDATSVCIVDEKGKKLLEISVVSDPESICIALRPHVGEIARIGIEASAMGMWLARELKAEGLPVIVVETRHMRSSLSAMRNKTDRNDAHGIAQMMRMGWFRAVHIKTEETQRLKTFLANRRLLKRKLIDLQNHIRGALRTYGLKVGTVGAGQFDTRVRELITDSDYMLHTMIESMLEVRTVLFESFQKLHRILLLIVRNDPVCVRFMTVPGVGPVTALSFKVTIDDPYRFTRSRTVGAHLGLTPRRYQSGTSVDWGGRISRMGDVDMRGALCEAAACLILRVKRYSTLKAWAMRIVKRSSKMCAIVALARKLAVILHRLWIDGTEYDWNKGAKITEKRKCDPETGLILNY
ncbi:IS110 family transposase [Sphingomonadales bacterium 56]|uniref:IS110 family transposase n=1 Tax=Sphingobium sp. S6 TaxID=2758386 RepID=UPI0019186544|nr:IS110 family transposase [Sphingobium sp. S6]MBY2929368.1 IS110 family transposase [Sphingomonadales bacterium 56]CAD7339316.1 IS110 family transposase ISRhru3 [Sphingobium sp. S6]